MDDANKDVDLSLQIYYRGGKLQPYAGGHYRKAAYEHNTKIVAYRLRDHGTS